MKQARINNRTVNKIWCYFLCRKKVQITQLQMAKTSLEEDARKKSMRSFILVKYEQLILCDCELLTRLEICGTHKIRWQ
jgi:hypothetical protein